MATGPTNQQGAKPQPGSTSPVGQPIGPLPADTARGQVAEVIPVWANFHWIVDQLNALQEEINNISPPGGVFVREVDTEFPIVGGPIIDRGTVGHATSSVGPTRYGDATHVAQFDVDKWGHITHASNVLITGGGGGSVSITAVSPITVTPSPTTNIGVITHDPSGVSPGTYGDSTHFMVATIEVDGHITNATLFPFSSVVIPGTFDWGKFLVGVRGQFCP